MLKGNPYDMILFMVKHQIKRCVYVCANVNIYIYIYIYIYIHTHIYVSGIGKEFCKKKYTKLSSLWSEMQQPVRASVK